MSSDSAYELWARLGAEGKVPTDISRAHDAVSLYSVGIEPWIDRLSQTYLSRLCKTNAHFKLVIAPYGGGKTHFLVSLGARALSENYAVSYIGCSDNIRFDNSLEIYRSFVSGITVPGAGGSGLRQLLNGWVIPHALEMIGDKAVDLKHAGHTWLNSLYASEYPEPSFARVSTTALKELIDPGSTTIQDASFRWLRGEIDTLTRDEMSYLRISPIPAKERNEFGRRMLLSMCRFVRMFGLNGTVMLFDEVETLFNAKGRALLRVLAAMRVLIDLPVGVSGGVPLFAIFSAVPDILEQFHKYQALKQRLDVVGASFSEGNNFAPQIHLGTVGSQKEFLVSLGMKLLRLGELATGHAFDMDVQSNNIRKLATVADERDLDINARRLFVKSCVNLLNHQTCQGEREYSEIELQHRYRGSFEDLMIGDPEEFEL